MNKVEIGKIYMYTYIHAHTYTHATYYIHIHAYIYTHTIYNTYIYIERESILYTKIKENLEKLETVK